MLLYTLACILSTFTKLFMEETSLDSIKHELINGYAKKRHPFRYFSLATLHKGYPRQRTVVLRKLLSDFTLLVYTDARSQKIADIHQDPKFSALFYHPKQLMQLKLEGEVQLITNTTDLQSHWQDIPEPSRKDYVTTKPPGTFIDHGDDVAYKTDHHFCIMKLLPERIEYLKLQRPSHCRILYTKTNGHWKGQYLVP